MANVRLSKLAYQDLEQIDAYTVTRWGLHQADRYVRELSDRFVQLADNPELGRARDALREGVRSLPADKHIIFYKCLDGDVFVLRILHHRRDPASALDMPGTNA